jgi:hypothetical protein
MAKRVYVDNSVIGGIHDHEFAKYSEALFREFRIGFYIPVISDVTETEIAGAPASVLKSFYELKKYPNLSSRRSKHFRWPNSISKKVV